jgi:hypothetical protein
MQAIEVARKIGEGFVKLAELRTVPGTEKLRAILRQRLARWDSYYRRQNEER